jgi:hypothetical protein
MASRGGAGSPLGPGWGHDNFVEGEMDIQKQREYNLIRQQLEKEFAEADVDRNGFITKDELRDFLAKKV